MSNAESKRKRGNARQQTSDKSRRGPGKLTPRAREDFLKKLAETANVTAACRCIGVSRQAAYSMRESDQEFAAAWDSAVEEAVDALEAEARRRGKEGYDEPVFQGGEQVGTIRKYSDTLLLAQLKAHRLKYRERLEVTDPDGKNPFVAFADALKKAAST